MKIPNLIVGTSVFCLRFFGTLGAKKGLLGMVGEVSSEKPRKWSAAVTEHSNALDLEEGIFKKSADEVARSLKRSAERSSRRKSEPYRSALSMLNFYMNRAGRNLSQSRRKTLGAAKRRLKKLFLRD